jgi:hypothetical protein
VYHSIVPRYGAGGDGSGIAFPITGATMTARPFQEFRDTPLWRALADTIAELEANREVKLETAPDYVIGYLCQELAAKWVIASSALTRER